MVVRMGRTGKFLACSAYPECKTTIDIPEEIIIFADGIPKPPYKISQLIEKYQVELEAEIQYLDETCDKCGAKMQLRSGRFGKFIACSAYPECKNTRQIVKEIGVDCPRDNCNGKMLEKKSKRNRIFYGCSNYPDCDLTTWAIPTGKLCPECNEPLVWHKTKKLGQHIKCSKKGCTYKEFVEGKENEEQKI